MEQRRLLAGTLSRFAGAAAAVEPSITVGPFRDPTLEPKTSRRQEPDVFGRNRAPHATKSRAEREAALAELRRAERAKVAEAEREAARQESVMRAEAYLGQNAGRTRAIDPQPDDEERLRLAAVRRARKAARQAKGIRS